MLHIFGIVTMLLCWTEMSQAGNVFCCRNKEKKSTTIKKKEKRNSRDSEKNETDHLVPKQKTKKKKEKKKEKSLLTGKSLQINFEKDDEGDLQIKKVPVEKEEIEDLVKLNFTKVKCGSLTVYAPIDSKEANGTLVIRDLCHMQLIPDLTIKDNQHLTFLLTEKNKKKFMPKSKEDLERKFNQIHLDILEIDSTQTGKEFAASFKKTTEEILKTFDESCTEFDIRIARDEIYKATILLFMNDKKGVLIKILRKNVPHKVIEEAGFVVNVPVNYKEDNRKNRKLVFQNIGYITFIQDLENCKNKEICILKQKEQKKSNELKEEFKGIYRGILEKDPKEESENFTICLKDTLSQNKNTFVQFVYEKEEIKLLLSKKNKGIFVKIGEKKEKIEIKKDTKKKKKKKKVKKKRNSGNNSSSEN